MENIRIKPGRYYMVRVRTSDKQWAGRWMEEISPAVKTQMEEDQHILFDFDLPEADHMTACTMGVRELSEYQNDRRGKLAEHGGWPGVVLMRRNEYRKFHGKD